MVLVAPRRVAVADRRQPGRQIRVQTAEIGAPQRCWVSPRRSAVDEFRPVNRPTSTRSDRRTPRRSPRLRDRPRAACRRSSSFICSLLTRWWAPGRAGLPPSPGRSATPADVEDARPVQRASARSSTPAPRRCCHLQQQGTVAVIAHHAQHFHQRDTHDTTLPPSSTPLPRPYRHARGALAKAQT